MNRSILLLLACLTLLSCRNTHTTKVLQGYWHHTYTKNPFDDDDHDTDLFDNIRFIDDDTFESKIGFYRYNSETRKLNYLGNRSHYKIKDDTLCLFNPAYKIWLNFKISKISPDQLELTNFKEIHIYRHQQYKYADVPNFDQIVVSHSGCFGPCPIQNTAIGSNGSITYLGIDYTSKKGLFTGKISADQFLKLQGNLKLNNLNALHEEYKTAVSDRETTTVTFIKDNKIYKTISDYGGQAPDHFLWARAQVDNLYINTPLKLVDSLANLPLLWNGWSYSLIKDDKAVKLPESEEFLLLMYLKAGKITMEKFNPVYKLHYFGDTNNQFLIMTDGRYYTIKGKNTSRTFDIGFNFIELNAGHWKWKKADKYN